MEQSTPASTPFCTFSITLSIPMESIFRFLEFTLIEIGAFKLTGLSILSVVFIFLGAQALLWGIGKLISRAARRRADKDPGRLQALLQIAQYIIYLLAFFLSLQTIGVTLTWLMTSSAALLVGIGFGLQNTFNDFLSGVIILFDGSIEVGDVVQVGDLVGKVKRIGIRTTTVDSRESIAVIVPNSKFTQENVINWSHDHTRTRFGISVGVAYGSNVEQVMQCLKEAATAHKLVQQQPQPRARFLEFGDSALLFDVLFWTTHTFDVEFIKSDIRVAIDAAFREAGISIPFPQRDLHIISNPQSPIQVE